MEVSSVEAAGMSDGDSSRAAASMGDHAAEGVAVAAIAQEVFDAHAHEYVGEVDKSVAFTGRDSEFFAGRKVDLLGEVVGGRIGGLDRCAVLDVGCGTGTTDKLLVDKCKSLSGVDVSEEMLVEARRNVPGVDYRFYDGAELPFEDGCFDVVLAICVLHHVEPPQRPGFVAELARVVRPGGLVTIFEHNPFNPLTRRAVSSCPVDVGVTLSSHRRTVGLLRAAGIADAQPRHYLFSPLGGSVGAAIDRLFTWLPMGGQYVAYGTPARRQAPAGGGSVSEQAHPSRGSSRATGVVDEEASVDSDVGA